MTRVLLPVSLCAIVALAYAGASHAADKPAGIYWTAPTTNADGTPPLHADGSPLTDLGGHIVSLEPTAGGEALNYRIDDPTVRHLAFNDMQPRPLPQEYKVVIYAFDQTLPTPNISEPSPSILVTVPAGPPPVIDPDPEPAPPSQPVCALEGTFEMTVPPGYAWGCIAVQEGS